MRNYIRKTNRIYNYTSGSKEIITVEPKIVDGHRVVEVEPCFIGFLDCNGVKHGSLKRFARPRPGMLSRAVVANDYDATLEWYSDKRDEFQFEHDAYDLDTAEDCPADMTEDNLVEWIDARS